MSLRSSTNPGQVIPVLQSGANLLGNSFSKLHSRADKRSTILSSHRSSSSQNLPSSPTSSTAPQLPEVAAMTAFQVYSTPSSTNSSASNGTHLSPSQQNTRRTSGAHSNADASPRSSQNTPASPLSPTSNGQWSSAVGHAGTGKSGRVIEKLMADNDKLKRELKEQVVKAEEFQRSLQTAQPRMEAFQAEIDNLSHAKGVDRSLLARRDRQIKELKEELAVEKKNRQASTLQMQQMQAARDEETETHDLSMQRMNEKTKHATNQVDVLQSSMKQLRAQCDSKLAEAYTEMRRLNDIIAGEQQKVSKLDIVSGQMRQENERGRKVQMDMLAQWDKLQQVYAAQMQGMQHQTDVENEKVRKLSVEMDKVVNEMRWVVGVKKNTSLGSPN